MYNLGRHHRLTTHSMYTSRIICPASVHNLVRVVALLKVVATCTGVGDECAVGGRASVVSDATQHDPIRTRAATVIYPALEDRELDVWGSTAEREALALKGTLSATVNEPFAGRTWR